nr:tRNA dihydrouridine(20/20a) synthase DusA [Rhizobiaceae bacterium]
QPDFAAVIDAMAAYADRHIASGGRLAHVSRHMIGLFHGLPGARRWRRMLSEEAVKPGADGRLLRAAAAEALEAIGVHADAA